MMQNRLVTFCCGAVLAHRQLDVLHDGIAEICEVQRGDAQLVLARQQQRNPETA